MEDLGRCWFLGRWVLLIRSTWPLDVVQEVRLLTHERAVIVQTRWHRIALCRALSVTHPAEPK